MPARLPKKIRRGKRMKPGKGWRLVTKAGRFLPARLVKNFHAPDGSRFAIFRIYDRSRN